MIGNHSSGARSYLSFEVFEFCFACSKPSRKSKRSGRLLSVFEELLDFTYLFMPFSSSFSDSICDDRVLAGRFMAHWNVEELMWPSGSSVSE